MTSPIFIGGTMRTGTTLLRALLGQHPRLFGGLETHWFGADFEEARRQPDGAAADRLRIFFDLDAGRYAQLTSGAATAEVFLNRLMRQCASNAGKPRWIEKSPDNVLHLERIADHWPDACFIHCVRDPRDVYASWKRDRKRSLDAYIDNALAALAATETMSGRLAIHSVRYDRLVQRPTDTLTEVCGFIDEAFVPGMENNASGRRDFEKVRDATGKESTVLVSLARPVFTDSLGQFRTILNATELERIERELEPYLERYFPGWVPASPRAHA